MVCVHREHSKLKESIKVRKQDLGHSRPDGWLSHSLAGFLGGGRERNLNQRCSAIVAPFSFIPRPNPPRDTRFLPLLLLL